VCAAVMFTMLLVSANTIAMSVRERAKEVGVLKVLGFTNAMVLGIILTEALVVSLLGGALGVLFASGMTGVVRRGPAFLDQLKTLSLSPEVAVICLGIAAAIGVISAFVPAYQASRISILEALRSTD
jgi:putative ABC transport system permease protein